MPEEIKKLYRSVRNRMILGVCGGIGEYLDTDPTVVRVIAVVAALFTVGFAVFAYLVCALIIPEKRES